MEQFHVWLKVGGGRKTKEQKPRLNRIQIIKRILVFMFAGQFQEGLINMKLTEFTAPRTTSSTLDMFEISIL